MERIEKQVMQFARRTLSPRRFGHVENVVATTDDLARAHDLDRTACRVIAWLHDCAKEEPGSRFLDLVESGKITIDPETLDLPKLWHGFHAAFLGKEKFGIDREDLLDAVRYHPTGAPGLCPEGLVLFIADYAEPGRPMDWTEEIRDQARRNLEKAALRVVNEKIEYLERKGKEPHSRSLAFRRWLRERGSNGFGPDETFPVGPPTKKHPWEEFETDE